MEKKRWDCTALPKGWKMEEVTRKSGLSAGKSDVYYFRYLNNMDLLTFTCAQDKEFADRNRSVIQRTGGGDGIKFGSRQASTRSVGIRSLSNHAG